MKQLVIFLVLSFGFSVAKGQSNRDSILFMERSIDRPVNLHGGQMRFTAGYGLSAITKSFDQDGNAIKLREDGVSYVRHSFPVAIQYGISEYLEIGVSTAYKSQIQREKEVISVGGVVITNLFQIYEKNGFEDLAISLKGRVPLNTRKIDLLLNAGAQVPVGSGKTKQPENTFSQTNQTSAVLRDVVYRDKPRWGNGTLIGMIGGTLKSRTPYYAFTIDVNFSHAFGESEDLLWRHQLVGMQYEYESESYQSLLPDKVSVFLEIERQLAPWFDLSFQFFHERFSGGWIEDSGLKLIRDESSNFAFSPGYELMVTPKVWLRQRVVFTLSGKATEGPLSFNTALVYNFFPF
jgi:hypothetical protein